MTQWSRHLVVVLAALTACGQPLPAPINHRPDDSQCSAPGGPGDCICNGACTAPEFTCTTDSQCTAGVNGRCIGSSGGPAGCGCTYDECASDSACPSGKTCACHGSPYMYSSDNFCVAGNCRVDSDCGRGGYCSPSPGISVVGYYCHTSNDSCTNDSECSTSNCVNPPSTPLCAYSTSDKRWGCVCFPMPV